MTEPPLQVQTTFPDRVFERAADVFKALSAPMRLKIISHLCDGEKSVSQLRNELNAAQPAVSQHLSKMYRAGVLGRRREGAQVHYRIIDPRVSHLCRTICLQLASAIR